MTDALWGVLDQAERRLLEEFAEVGVVRVEWVVGFIDPPRISVWLGTSTDAERNALADPTEDPDHFVGDALLTQKVAKVLEEAGLKTGDGWFHVVVVQSQETVDRDYEGRWFLAMR